MSRGQRNRERNYRESRVVQPTPSIGWHLTPVAAFKNGKLRWVSCSREDAESLARSAHLLRDSLNTLCGAAAGWPEVWSTARASRKPACEDCAAVLDAYDKRGARLRRAVKGE